MNVTLIVAHEYDSPRKVGFHFWADYLVAAGHKVSFVSIRDSWIGLLKGRSLVDTPNKWLQRNDLLASFSWKPPFHPCLNKPVLNALLMPLFRRYGDFFPQEAMDKIADSDLVIVESGGGLALIPRLREKCPNAVFIYQASDRLKTVGAHPAILEAEQKALPCFNAIRVPAEVMRDDFVGAPCPVLYIPQGMDKSHFEEDHASPYETGKNVVSVGDMLFDEEVIATLAKNFPDWTFHLFGRKAHLSTPLPNVISYGETPIRKLTAYIRHADIGLAPYRTAPNCEYLSQSSLKMVQYTYCKLPIVAPAFAARGRDNVLTYESSAYPDQVCTAFRSAISFDRNRINTNEVLSWSEVLQKMLDAALVK